MTKNLKPLDPSVTTLVKIGSLIIHYQEWISSKGHPNDKLAIDALEKDPEVVQWLRDMTSAAFIPVKR